MSFAMHRREIHRKMARNLRPSQEARRVQSESDKSRSLGVVTREQLVTATADVKPRAGVVARLLGLTCVLFLVGCTGSRATLCDDLDGPQCTQVMRVVNRPMLPVFSPRP